MKMKGSSLWMLVLLSVLGMGLVLGSSLFVSGQPGPPGPGPNPPGGPPQAGGFVVVDSSGAVVGDLVGYPDPRSAAVLFKHDGKLYPVFLTKDGFVRTLWSYEALDCKGPLSEGPSRGPNAVGMVLVGLPGSTIYAGDEEPAAITSLSHLQGDICINSSQTPGGPGGFPALSIRLETTGINLDQLFTPPFRIEPK